MYSHVIALVFDTTSSNTGVRSGSATFIELELEIAVLWLACRHHIHELHIRHVWNAVGGEARSPVEPLLNRFQQEWNEIEHQETTDIVYFDWPMDSSSTVFECAKSTLHWGEICLAKETFPREDYRELLELTVIYLGGHLPGKPKVVFRKPGAAHHRARFMHNEIYFLKMQLLSERFGMNQEEREAVKRMADYIRCSVS